MLTTRVSLINLALEVLDDGEDPYGRWSSKCTPAQVEVSGPFAGTNKLRGGSLLWFTLPEGVGEEGSCKIPSNLKIRVEQCRCPFSLVLYSLKETMTAIMDRFSPKATACIFIDCSCRGCCTALRKAGPMSLASNTKVRTQSSLPPMLFTSSFSTHVHISIPDFSMSFVSALTTTDTCPMPVSMVVPVMWYMCSNPLFALVQAFLGVVDNVRFEGAALLI